MYVLGLDGSTMFLVLISRAVSTTSQDASGGSSLTWPKPFVCLSSQQHVFSLCVHSVLKDTFMHGLKSGKGVCVPYVLSILHSSPLS